MSHPVVPGFLVSLVVATGLGLIGASELWAVLAVHTGRRVAPSARFRLVGDGPTWGSPSEQFSV